MNTKLILAITAVLTLNTTAFAAPTCPDWVQGLDAKKPFDGMITYDPNTTNTAADAVKDPSSVWLTFRPKNCTVVGQFSYFDSASKKETKGQFSQTRILPDRQLEMVWHDKYGFGLLKIQFTPELNAFTGQWGAPKTNEPSGQWTGAQGPHFSCRLPAVKPSDLKK